MTGCGNHLKRCGGVRKLIFYVALFIFLEQQCRSTGFAGATMFQTTQQQGFHFPVGDVPFMEQSNIQHRDLTVDCSVAFVYNVPVSCGHSFIGQTSCCLNRHILEHESYINNQEIESQLVHHLQNYSACECQWNDTTILEKQSYKRLVNESLHIFLNYYCIRHSPLSFGEKTNAFLVQQMRTHRNGSVFLGFTRALVFISSSCFLARKIWPCCIYFFENGLFVLTYAPCIFKNEFQL